MLMNYTGRCDLWLYSPAGNLIASTQRAVGRHAVIFFERNGLRHGEFTLRHPEARVVELEYNCDSTLLMVWLHYSPEAGGHHAGTPLCRDPYFLPAPDDLTASTRPFAVVEVLRGVQCSCGP